MQQILYPDERAAQLNGTVSFYCLMLTHLALVAVILTKRYLFDLPPGAYRELSWIAGLSMGGYWTLRLYLSGILPVIRLRALLITYLALVALIFIPTYLIHGWPAPERWYEVLYPFGGVAVVLGYYTLVSVLGKRRLEQIAAQDGE